MKCSLFVLLLLLSRQVLLVDEVYTIPGADWRFIELILQQQRSRVECDFRVISGAAAFASRSSVFGSCSACASEHARIRWNRVLFRPYEESSDRLKFLGHYALIIENRREPARVQLRVNVE